MKKFKIAAIVVTTIILAIYFANILPQNFKYGFSVKEQATIERLEISDPNYHADVKVQLSDIIETKTGERPEKVAS